MNVFFLFFLPVELQIDLEKNVYLNSKCSTVGLTRQLFSDTLTDLPSLSSSLTPLTLSSTYSLFLTNIQLHSHLSLPT